MESLFLILAGITALFFVILGVREFFSRKTKEKICSICFAVSVTWVFLLLMFWMGKFSDKTILAVLMGQSSLGLYYLWEHKAKDKSKVFRLPFLLTLILAAYSLVEGFSYGYNVIIFIIILWAFFFVVYLYGSDGKTGGFVRKLVECCKKW